MSSIGKTEKIEECQTILDYQFVNPDLLWEALQAAGSPVSHIGTRHLYDGNKTLAVVGDAVLKLVLLDQGYTGNKSKGIMNNTVSSYGSNANLDIIGRRTGLDRLVNGNPSQWGVVSPKTMADTVEAILGAVYRDGGLQAAVKVMGTLGLMPA